MTENGEDDEITRPQDSDTLAQPAPYFETFAGLSKHTWVDRPDTKYNADGLYKTKLVGELSNPKVAAFKDKVDAAAAAALLEETKDLSVVQRKKWEPYLPYDLELDETTGEPTDRIIFEFKRNAKVTIRKTGEVKELSVAVYDSKRAFAALPPYVPGGSLIRIAGSFRPIKIVATSKAGVRMDFFAVQVLKLNAPLLFAEEIEVDGGGEVGPAAPRPEWPD